MSLPDKTCAMAEAIARIPDGASVMLGGFGVPGTPFCLIEALVEHGARDLTIIKNDANEAGIGVDWLLQAGQVRRLITSHIGLNPRAVAMMNDGSLDVEFNAQGILAERIRAAGAGVMGFVTNIGMDTVLAEGKQRVETATGEGMFEPALHADFALVHADCADHFGNLSFAASARNFNPLIATAARCVIAEAERVVPLGGIAPDDVHTPGPFVDHVVELPTLPEVYGVVQR
ncbi:CoA transferase subunit A [Sediminimonas sp.]|uniref:CoA transferase subunit A n=1 Tax=Sediminimonas sp. TaxID=2823379 RepID=UPI0025D30596|nr:CoA transferase subunit A [Sediminimonas sp.]